MDLAIQLLGPLELCRGRETLPAGGPIQRAVLAMLALHDGQPVTIGELVDGVWGESEEQPEGGNWLWVHVSRIRALLKGGDGDPLRTVPGGYCLRSDGIVVDTHAFGRLLDAGREQLAAGDPASAAATLDQALALWRGPALMDLRDFPFAVGVATRYDELRLDAAEERIEARLAVGEARALLSELHSLIADHPYRERLHRQLMVALYRSGRQADALEAYQAARTRLIMDLGVAPGPELEQLHRQILQQADVLRLPTAPSAVQRDTPVHVASVPRNPTLFGRDRQLAVLGRLADRERVITLTGPGGCGKTVLALALMHRVLPRFGNRGAFVDLASVGRPEHVLPAIAAALGMSQVGAPLSERLAEYLSEQRVVILLDNVEHVLAAVPDLAPMIDTSIGLVIATSRSPLGLRAEHVVIVPPLTVPAVDDSPTQVIRRSATRLFLHAVAAAGGEVGRTPEEISAAGQICRAVDGLPLAIEIAAAQARAEALPELAAHLQARLPGLERRVRDVPARQRTMNAAIGWSLDRLTGHQRSQLPWLAEFRGPFGAAGAAAVCRMGPDSAMDLVAELVDASLLSRQASVGGQARFRMLEPTRAVVREQAAEAILDQARGRHAAFMVSEIERLSPADSGIQRPQDLAALKAEYPDLQAALGYLAGIDRDRCATLLFQLGDFWQWTGRELEAKRLADELLDTGRFSAGATCMALTTSMWGAFLLSRLDEAGRAIDRALELAEQVPDPSTRALVHWWDGRYGIWSGSRERALHGAREAARYARRANDHRLLALSLAIRALADPDDPDGEAWLEEAIGIARERSMAFTEVWALGVLGVRLDARDPVRAASAERSILETMDRYQALEGSSLIANNLAYHILQSGAVEEARAILLMALRSADRAGHRVWAAMVATSLGEVEAARQRWTSAAVLLSAGAAVSARSGMIGLTGPSEQDRLADLLRSVVQRLGVEKAAAATSRGEAMTYRELVDYAFEVNGLATAPNRFKGAE